MTAANGRLLLDLKYVAKSQLLALTDKSPPDIIEIQIYRDFKAKPVQRGSQVPRDSANAAWWRLGNGVARDLEIVLNFLRVKGASTKSFVARETGFSRAVVAQRLADLQSSGLVIESGRDPSSGGRPPQKIQFNADRGHVLVADLGATSIDVAVADLDGRIHAHTSEEADISAGPEIILGQVEQLFEKLRATSAEARGVPWGIGVGLPGPVEFNTGRPVAPPIMPGWDAYPVRERLSDRFDVPVWVDNDVNVMALGERAEGSARGIDDFIFIKIGTGIGAGIVSHGTIQRGVQGSAETSDIFKLSSIQDHLSLRQRRLPGSSRGRCRTWAVRVESCRAELQHGARRNARAARIALGARCSRSRTSWRPGKRSAAATGWPSYWADAGDSGEHDESFPDCYWRGRCGGRRHTDGQHPRGRLRPFAAPGNAPFASSTVDSW